MAEDRKVNISIPLVDVDQIKTGRGSGGRKGTGAHYGNYAKAVAPIVPYLKEQIAESKDKSIRIKTADIAVQMGLGKKHETSVYWGLKYVLYQEGIWVTTGQTKSEEAVLVMRDATENDVLPESLRKKLPSNEVDSDDSDTSEDVDGAETDGSDEKEE